MIVKMDKYSFLLLDSNLEQFLERLQGLGMVDITRETRAIDKSSKELFERISKGRETIKRLSSLYPTLLEQESPSSKYDYSSLTQQELFIEGEELLKKRREYAEHLTLLDREYQESLPWGIFQESDIERLKKIGYTLYHFSILEKRYNSDWEKEYPIEILNRVNGRVYFILLQPNDERLDFELTPIKSPNRSYQTIELERESLYKERKEIDLKILSLLAERERMESYIESSNEEVELYLAQSSSQREAEGKIAILIGFAPEESRAKIEELLKREEVYHIVEKAEVEDNPPIKLKNSFFSRLYEPIGELYMLPTYGETDLTPFFAPFYMLFFGLCLGDMGYGLTIMIGATIAKFKFSKFRDYLTLAQFLGLGALIMASLSGTFFGMQLQEIIPMSDSLKALFFSDLKMFWFSIIFGLVQIVFARLLNAIFAIKNRGWQYGLHNIGWSILIIWAAWYYATTISDITIPHFMKWVALFGASLVLLFTSDSGNIFTRLFKGTFAFYDVTSLFGDMLSYIRLFGLGISGGILGMVVNSVAISLAAIPYLGWFFALIMLLIGHTLVLLLSSLGAFVHPMRLTFVEFYKNAGFTGGGRAYRPLKKNQIN